MQHQRDLKKLKEGKKLKEAARMLNAYSMSIMAPTYRDHYFGHEIPSLKDCHWCQIRSFSNANEYPISIVCKDESLTLPSDFTFIEKSILREGVSRADPEFRVGCECSHSCHGMTCHCLQDSEVDLPDHNVYAYQAGGNSEGCLKEQLLDSKAPIYECHEACACDETCDNRIVARGRRVPLQVFRTENRGWGVRSKVPIKAGAFIDCYIGEIITAQEAERRRDNAIISRRKDLYLFSIDKFTDPDSLNETLRGDPYVIDGEFYAGPSRFFNHSCEANMRIFARVGDYSEKNLHDLAFFAIEDIRPMTELTFDYVDGKDDGEQGSEKCLCGAKSCRGWLW
ncbi:similar to gi/24987775/pdb/1ML9/A Chain A [Botrytis cinerea T4]|nr:similar to gi/24987775/pdb/1ML9/A Chain A [Botrytis cinerea T4]